MELPNRRLPSPDKWFKPHKGEPLTLERFDHIYNVAGLLGETIRVQKELRDLNV